MSLINAVKILKNRYSRSTPGKYYAIAALIVGILFVVGLAIKRNLDAEDKRLTDLATQQRVERESQEKIVSEKLDELKKTVKEAENLAASSRRQVLERQVEINLLKENLSSNQKDVEALESKLSTANKEIMKGQLKSSFLAENIMTRIRQMYPMVTTEHLFFSETQSNLFRTNPATAHLLFMTLVDHSVQAQLITKLHGSVNLLIEQAEQSEEIISLRSEELISISSLVDDYQFTQEQLEASLRLDRRFIETLEKQITIMRRRNLFQRILPSLNVVMGPYWDPFRNTTGFAVSLGLGWRF